jgi:hypothetical protein
MKQILASLALLVGQFSVTPHNGIADRTLGLSLHRTINIPLERS